MTLPIHREGYPFIALFAAVNLLAFLFAAWLGWVLLPVTVWCVAFFRDPERHAPEGDDLIICPADGRLLPIVEAVPPAELGLGEEPRPRLSVFMNVFNVHVNRNPVSGSVVAQAYRPGRFFNASFDKASIHNERMSIRLRPDGRGETHDLAVVQIAGLVARRIVCDLTKGQGVLRGARFGIIRFGSRVDVFLPQGTEILAGPGSRVRAGETVLARFV
ncbi:MAG: phosphatidylserine decarboxylase [Alphaproteobacteria bacterium 64-11]|nr:phosphatidylserine decarboxylase [Alphaproteobacteria bacterium]OJU07897.1 MAG: phosphatidylserine decarboxylase [Alphaproteobacteria bacterium 64-11]